MLDEIATRYPKDVRIVYRHLPLDGLHPRARASAEAAACAEDGNKFWEYHDKLFANNRALGDEELRKYAAEVGLDAAAFDQCVKTRKYASAVEVRPLEDDPSRLGAHLRHAGSLRGHPHGHRPEEALDRRRHRPESVAQLVAEGRGIGVGADGGEAPVDLQLRARVAHVGIGQVGGARQVQANGPGLGLQYVRKPLYSREGANVSLVGPGLGQKTEGSYGEEGHVYQAYSALPVNDGQHAVIGSWVIAGQPAGIGVREDPTPITHNLSRFVPHYF